MKLLVSACLLGVPCRYDGTSKPCPKVMALEKNYILIPVCPEVLGGLSIPHPPAERLGSCVITQDGSDMTEAFYKGAQEALRLAKQHGCTHAVLKEKSPSCGAGRIYDGSFSKTLVAGNGVTAELLLQNDITVLGEKDIDKLPNP